MRRVAPLLLLLTTTALAEDGLAPDKALEAFRLEPGLKIELAAGEPQVVSPCAMAFDERGRLFVAENRGYPTGPKEGEPPVGRIAMLEDLDGDGRYEKRTEFAEGLTYPNGVMRWRGGLIVTCAPDILYLKDTDGDGRADTREVWFTGFSTKGSTQLRVSHPTLAIDGWIYVTSGLTGGDITCPKHPEREAVKIGRTDFRFRPDLSEYEPCDGGAQFGLTFDDFGHRFICYNRVQVQHVVLASKFLRRNPHLAFSETVQNCPAEMEAEPLKGHGTAARLFPISSNITTADSHAGTFTAACAVTAWRGDSLPLQYDGGVFSCDPTGNLVHFDLLERSGATFSARRARDGMEFLASTDNWFRPVFLSHGPDGALYVVDMYRRTIEHPDYLPVEIRKHTDFESGKTMGRVWRVFGAKFKSEDLAERRGKRFDAMSAEDLCQALDSPNGWRRSTAFRLLLEANDPASAPAIKRLLTTANSTGARVAALRLLDGLGSLDAETWRACLKDTARGSLREHAVVIGARSIRQSAEIADDVRTLANDRDARVRFQVALALGDLKEEAGVAELVMIARTDSADRWTRAAVLSSISGRERLFFERMVGTSANAAVTPELLFETGRLLGASQPERAWPDILRQMAKDEDAGRAGLLLTGLGEALRNRGVGKKEAVLLEAAGDSAEVRELVKARYAVNAKVAADSSASADRRQQAVDLLAHADFATAGAILLKLVDAHEPVNLQSAALRALSRMQDDSIAATLLEKERFAAYTPSLRNEVLSAMLTGPQHIPGLLTAIEQDVVPRVAIDSIRKRQLMGHRDPAVRQRAERLFSLESAGNRAKVYEEMKSLVALPSNATSGRAVFKKTCASCHRLDREGYAVGPDLFGIRNQPKEAILLHVLIPEQEITPGFAAYVLTTKEGRVLTGLVSSETPTSVTLKQPQGKEETILRTDIEELAASRLSLMPQNLETQLTRQDFADLLAYLKGEK